MKRHEVEEGKHEMENSIRTVGIFIKKTPDEAFAFASSWENAHLWHMDADVFQRVEGHDDLFKVTVPLYSSAEMFAQIRAEPKGRTIFWKYGFTPEELSHVHCVRVVDAQDSINREGSMLLCTVFRHQKMDDMTWDVLPSYAHIQLLNVKEEMEGEKAVVEEGDSVLPVHIQVDASPEFLHEYLSSIPKLSEWTLNCNTFEETEPGLWYGRCTGYKGGLWYKVDTNAKAKVFTWYCGREKGIFPHCYQCQVVSAKETIGVEGAIFIWICFRNPTMPTHIPKFLLDIHTYESRKLKTVVEEKPLSERRM